MTTPTRPNFLSRVLDIVFGRPPTPEERRLAEASGPPRAMRRVFEVLFGASLLCVLILAVSRWGWLQIVDQQIASDWLGMAVVVNLVMRLGWEQIVERYRHRAMTGRAFKAASPE